MGPCLSLIPLGGGLLRESHEENWVAPQVCCELCQLERWRWGRPEGLCEESGLSVEVEAVFRDRDTVV